jgi:hypothetical protein
MSDPAKSSAAPADDAAGAVDEFAHIPRPTTRHPLIAIGGAVLAVYLVFHLRHDLRYALSSGEPVDAGAARTSFGAGAESPGAALENRFVRVAGTPDRESALEIDTKGSWVFSQFFRMLGTGDRLFLHRRENPLPAARAESEVFEGRLVRFGELPFADSIRAYFAKHVTATHFFAPEAFARAVADRAGSPGLGLVDRNGDAVRLAGDETIALEIARPERVQIGLPRTRFPTEAEARAAVASRGGEVLVARGLVHGASAVVPDAGPLSAAPPAPERWTFVVGFPAGRRQAALDEIGDLDHRVEIRDARETIAARIAELAAAPGGIAVRPAGAPERRLGTGELGAVHTLAPVVIPDDAYLLVEGDRPREHVASVFLALILVVFATANVAGLIRNRR